MRLYIQQMLFKTLFTMNTLHNIPQRSTLLLMLLVCGLTLLLAGCDDDNGSNSTNQVELTSLQPVRGEAGDTVRVYGVGFGETTDANRVYFNGQQAAVDTVNEDATMLVTRVPSAATTGPVSVSVDGAPSRGGLYFHVIQPAPEPEPAPRQVYWTGRTRNGEYVVKTTYMEGGAPATETVYTMEDGFSEATGLAIDLAGGQIYFTDPEGGYVGRASLDGNSAAIDTLYAGDAEGATTPEYLALDTQNDYVYWSDADRIMRGGLTPGDTPKADTVYTTLTTPSASNTSTGLWLDVEGNNLYWTERGDESRVQLGTLDGAALPTTLYGRDDAQPEIDYIWNMAVDTESKRIYVSDRYDNRNSRILIGNNQGDGFLKTVLLGAEEGVALSPLAIDSQDRYLYWSQSLETDQLTRIMRAPLMEGGIPGQVQVAYDNAALDDIEVIFSIAVGPAGNGSAKARGGGGSAIQLHF